MSEKDDEGMKSSEQSSSYINEYPQIVPYIYITDADNFITQCREFLDKDKLTVPGQLDPPERSSGSDILLRSLTEQDFHSIHHTLFTAWKTIKSENTKVLPTLNPPKSWPPQHNRAIEDEETLYSFEEAKSKFDVAAYSQIVGRPISPDLLDLYNSEIRVANAPLRKAISLNVQGKQAAADAVPKLVFRSQNWSKMTQDEVDELNRETTPLLAVLKRSAYLELSIRLFEWAQADLKRKAEAEVKQSPAPSPSECGGTTTLKLPPKLVGLKDFSIWLLNQSKKLYDVLHVPEKTVYSDDTSQNTSSADTKDSNVLESSSKSPIMLPPLEGKRGPNPQQDLSLNAFSDDTLSGITPISTDTESAPGKDKGPRSESEESSTSSFIQSSTGLTSDLKNSPSGPKLKRQRSPDDSVSSPKRKTV